MVQQIQFFPFNTEMPMIDIIKNEENLCRSHEDNSRRRLAYTLHILSCTRQRHLKKNKKTWEIRDQQINLDPINIPESTTVGCLLSTSRRKEAISSESSANLISSDSESWLKKSATSSFKTVGFFWIFPKEEVDDDDDEEVDFSSDILANWSKMEESKII